MKTGQFQWPETGNYTLQGIFDELQVCIISKFVCVCVFVLVCSRTRQGVVGWRGVARIA